MSRCDLTVEYFWACAAYVDFVRTSPRLRATLGLVEPKCHWNQYNDNGEPKDGKCPCCSGELTSVPYGV